MLDEGTVESLPETPYGFEKRIRFLIEEVERLQPTTVLDVGCGTGQNVTLRLARRFPQIQFLGVDEDQPSIVAARAQASPNARFEVSGSGTDAGQFDLVVCSEVLEHVEDPPAFLLWLRERVAPGGRLILTTPNGYGPFEQAMAAFTICRFTGIWALFRIFRRALRGGIAGPDRPPDTLAVSPHVNFFGHRSIRRLFEGAGLRVERYKARTLLCGFVWDRVLRSRRILEWNARIADRLPVWCASGWMFTLEPTEPKGRRSYRRGLYGRIRRRLNLKMAGLS